MKVHLLLDSDIEPILEDNDVLLISRYNHMRTAYDNVIIIDLGKSNESSIVRDEMTELYTNFDKEYKKTLNSSYVRLFLPLESVLETLEELLSNSSFSEIVLYEGSTVPFFKSENAEGEGLRKHYKTNWMVNAFVKAKYERYYKITWVARCSQLYTRIKSLFYNTINCILLLAPRIVNRLRSFNDKKELQQSSARIISFVSLQLQKRHLDSILPEVLKLEHIYFSFNKSVVDRTRVFPVVELPLSTLFSIVISILIKKRLPTRLMYKGFYQYTLSRELQFIQLKYSIYENRMIQTLSAFGSIEKRLMLSNTTFGDDMMGIHSVAKHYGMHHVNIQYVSMDRIFYPNLKLADEYFIYAQKAYDFYKQKESSFKLYLPMNSIPQKKKEDNIFVIFMQPDSFCDDYFEYFRILFPAFNELESKYKIIVKPHYRQNKLDSLYDLCGKYSFVRVAAPNENVASLLNQASVIMSICSSVIFEAMMSYVPSIIYNPNDKYHSFVYNNDYCFPEVNIITSNPLESLDILDKYDDYYNNFMVKLQSFIKGYGATTDVMGIFTKYLS